MRGTSIINKDHQTLLSGNNKERNGRQKTFENVAAGRDEHGTVVRELLQPDVREAAETTSESGDGTASKRTFECVNTVSLPQSSGIHITDSVRIRWCFKKAFSVDRFHRYLESSLEKGHLTNDGPLQARLQKKIRAFVRTQAVVLTTCNGTAALHALVAGHSLRRGQRLQWITQAFTFPSAIQGPLANCLVCDIDEVLGGPSMKYMEENKDKFDGVIVTNVFGFQTEMLQYEAWCRTNGKLLVFDNAATPLGFVKDGRSIHDVGDGSFISFHETKPCGRGEGGAVLVSREVAPFVHQAMNFGYDIPNQVRVPNRQSSNWRMSDFAAAVICDHIDTMLLDRWEERLNFMVQSACEQLRNTRCKMAATVRYPTIVSCLFVKTTGRENGADACKRLNAHGIEAKHYYTPLVSRSEAPTAWKLYDTTVCLPFHLGISDLQLTKMILLLDSPPELPPAVRE